jgi:outer membrane protein TolC
MKRIISIFLLTPLLAPLGAQPLDSLLALVDQHPSVVASQLESRAEAERMDQVTAWPDPMVSASWFALPVETRLGAQRVRVGAGMDIPWQGALDNRREVVGHQAVLPLMAAENSRANLAYELAAAYYELTAIDERIRLLRRDIEWLEVRKRLTESRLEQNQVGVDALFQVELEREALLGEISALEQAAAGPRSTINGLLLRDPGTPISTPDELEWPAWPVEDPELDRHPSLLQVDTRQAIADRRLAQVRWDRRPMINAGIDYIVVSPRTDASPEGNGRDILAPRLGVSLPLSRKKYAAQEREVRIEKEALAEKRQDAHTRLTTLLANRRSAYEEADQRYHSLLRQLEWAERRLPVLQSAWSQGQSTMEELLNAHRQTISLRQGLIRQKEIANKAVAAVTELLTNNQFYYDPQ